MIKKPSSDHNTDCDGFLMPFIEIQLIISIVINLECKNNLLYLTLNIWLKTFIIARHEPL